MPPTTARAGSCRDISSTPLASAGRSYRLYRLLDELLAKLQESGGTVYGTLASGPDRAFAESENETEKRVLVAEMAEANLKVSNYVRLLGGLREAMRTLADAVRSGGSSASLASLSASSEMLLSDAMAASRAIAMFRAQGVEP